jgi:hypothetical protein
MVEQHTCAKQQQIDLMHEDVITIKTALGYKEKSNGQFRREIEETDKNLSERLQSVEIEVTKIGSTLNSIKWLMAIVLPIFGALMVEILLKL